MSAAVVGSSTPIPADEKKKLEVHGFTYDSAYKNPEIIKPSDDAVNEKTLIENEDAAFNGDFTKDLSDITDVYEGRQLSHSVTRFALTSLYRNVQPLIRDPKVRFLAIINLLLSVICIGLFTLLVLYGIQLLKLDKHIAMLTTRSVPCLFEWSDWGPCSATCRTSSDPFRERHVLPQSIVRARGKFPPCPDRLKSRREFAPCNVYRCPIKLSSLNWTQCFFNDPAIGPKQGCYRMREVPTREQLIEIDTEDFVKDCQCPRFVA